MPWYKTGIAIRNKAWSSIKLIAIATCVAKGWGKGWSIACVVSITIPILNAFQR